MAGSCATDADHSLDLPQTFLSRGVVAYVANTGYGWGLKHGIGYGERLSELLTEELTKRRDGGVRGGGARTKQRYYLETPRFDSVRREEPDAVDAVRAADVRGEDGDRRGIGDAAPAAPAAQRMRQRGECQGSSERGRSAGLFDGPAPALEAKVGEERFGAVTVHAASSPTSAGTSSRLRAVVPRATRRRRGRCR